MKAILAALFLCTLSSLYAQQKVLAAKEIEQLKNGILVVRLDFRSKAIRTYRENGMKEIAERIQGEQKDFNQTLHTSFKTSFTFCPTYFIRLEDYDTVINKQAIGMLLDSNLQFIPFSSLPSKNIFILDFGTVYQSAESYSPDADLTQTRNNRTDTAGTLSTPSIVECLVIKNRNLRQLSDPFPFYVRKKFSIRKAVIALNEKLLAFYSKTR